MALLLKVCGVLVLACIVAILSGSLAWCLMEAVDKIFRLFRCYVYIGEYFIHRARFRVWLAKVKGEKVRNAQRFSA